MSIETKIFELGKWSIRSVQLIGYLPLSVTKSLKSTSLSFKILTPSVLITLTLLIISACWEFNFFYNIKSYSKYMAIFGSTEKYAHNFFIIVSCLIGIYFRITGLLSGHETLKFWKENCETFEKLQVTLGYRNSDFLDKGEFSRIKKRVKRSVILNFITIIIHCIVVHGYQAIWSVLDETVWADDSELYFVSVFWACLILVHIFNAKWISFFIQIYTAGFDCIANCIEDVQQISEIKGIIYISEIFPYKKQESENKTSYEIQLNHCIEAFKILEKQVTEFNDFFGGKLIIEMFLCITNLVVDSFFATLWLGRGGFWQMAQLIVPFSVFANQLYCLGTVSSEMTLAAKRVGTAIFENISFQNLDTETRVKLQILGTKIGNGPPVISARHFFVVNRHLVTSVLSAMTTFLVVLVQFRDADETGLPVPRTNKINPPRVG